MLFPEKTIQWLKSPPSSVALAVLALVAFKLVALEAISREFLGCQWCLSPHAVPHEAMFVLLLLLLHLIANTVRQVWLRVMLRLTMLSLVLLMALDLAVSYEFWTRLTLHDFMEYLPEIRSVFTLGRSMQPTAWTLVSLALAGMLAVVVCVRYLRSGGGSRLSGLHVFWISILMFGCSALEHREFHERYIDNVLEVFFESAGEKLPYSDAFAQSIPASDPAAPTCLVGQDARVNVILLVVESLSMFHSQHFSGLSDWTPELDKLARQGLTFTNFYANGFTTEQGLVSLLTGEPPIDRAFHTGATLFSGFEAPRRSLPDALQQSGYDTAFLTTGNLSFLDKGDWLRNLGFGMVEGHEAPFYEGLTRYNFDAADDSALYGRTLQVVDSLKNPYFVTVETVTTHLPYIDPETGEHSAEKVYRYADKALGQFVRSLRQRRFFDHGILLVTGDHRAMVPMLEAERARYGDYGYARLPLVAVGQGLAPGQRVEDRFSQTDLLPSLVHFTTRQRQCLSAHEGVFLPQSQHQPQCSFTRRSYHQSGVYARCADADVSIQLAGDQTRVESAGPAAAVLHSVNRLRLGRGF